MQHRFLTENSKWRLQAKMAVGGTKWRPFRHLDIRITVIFLTFKFVLPSWLIGNRNRCNFHIQNDSL